MNRENAILGLVCLILVFENYLLFLKARNTVCYCTCQALFLRLCFALFRNICELKELKLRACLVHAFGNCS